MKGTIKDALVSLQVLAISQADDDLQELAESGVEKLAALTAERDALKEALKKQTEITWRLLGAIPYGNNPYAIHYVETVTGNHDDLLAKLEV